jgi:Tol biopolymer transport system component
MPGDDRRMPLYPRALVALTITLVAACFAVLAFAAPSALAAFPGANGKIVFDTNRDGNYEIYTMNAGGGGQTRLTNNTAVDTLPAWSADGTKIAFSTGRDGNYEIYTMNADGTGQTRLTNNAA